MADRTRARELAAEFHRKGDLTGWFEVLYREGAAGKSIVPWGDRGANPRLVEFANMHPFQGAGKKALTIGCGLGDDAELVASWGFATTAFDISETAVRLCRERFSGSAVEYLPADLLQPPQSWRRHFDFIFEANTLQVLPGPPRMRAIENIAGFLAPGGLLLVICRGRKPSEPEGQLPWPLTRDELSHFAAAGLEELLFEDIVNLEEPSEPPVRRFRALYQAKSV
jgi:SAM-dependent methyltransferase